MAGSWNEMSPFDPNHPGILTILRVKLLKFKNAVYSTALSHVSHLYPCVHTPPSLLGLCQVNKEAEKQLEEPGPAPYNVHYNETSLFVPVCTSVLKVIIIQKVTREQINLLTRETSA